MERTPERLLRGRGRFVDDLRLDGMLHMKMVRSPYARARLLKVEGGMTAKELKADLTSVGEGSWGGPVKVSFPALARDYVSYAGQPVAAVIADDPYKAEDMMEEVEVEYEPLRPLVDPEKASSFEPIHPGSSSNVVSDVTLGSKFREEAAVVVEDSFTMERVSANPMEPRGLVASYDGSGLTVWASTQSVHTWKEAIAGALKLPEGIVRVVQMDTGGAFGTKSGLYPEYVAACYASMKAKRPVKWVETRTEHLLASNQGRGSRGRLKLFADREGRVSGLTGDILVDNGAFAIGIGAASPRIIGFELTGPYAIRKVYVHGASVYTNKVPLGPYRGAGRPEAGFFIERMMDRLADELGMDPVEIRLRNTVDGTFVSPLGLKIEAFHPFLEKAAQELGYARRKGRGVGFSSFILLSAVQPGEAVRVSVKGGRVRVWLGGSQSGQPHDVIAKEVLGTALGFPQDVIDLQAGDTDELDEGVGTWGSRTAIAAGDALIEAAAKIRELARKELGSYDPVKALQGEFDVTVFHEETEQTSSFGANLVRASVKETGEAKAEECFAYYDIGRVLDRRAVIGQVVGGTAQAIGEVLSEEASYNEDGQLVNATLSDMGLPSAGGVPNVVVMLAEGTPSSRRRIKGVGEAATIGVPPAFVRGLETLLGRRLNRTPLHPEDLVP
jgi:carbon-monoxide dehydrogenase large subunit